MLCSIWLNSWDNPKPGEISLYIKDKFQAFIPFFFFVFFLEQIKSFLSVDFDE